MLSLFWKVKITPPVNMYQGKVHVETQVHLLEYHTQVFEICAPRVPNDVTTTEPLIL